MSRCYPYPPPGYQKKAQLSELSVPAKVAPKEKKKSKEKEKEKKGKDPGQEKEKKAKDSEKEKKASDKEKKVLEIEKEKQSKDVEKEKIAKGSEKEKDKKVKDASQKEKKDKDKSKDKDKRDKDKRDKDKKEKRKKDGETNGVAHDKDPRSSKLQRTSLVNDVLHSTGENGRLSEIKTPAVVPCPLDRDGRDAASLRGSSEGPGFHPPSMYIKKEQQPNGKVEPTLPPLVLSTPVGGSPPDVEAAPSSWPSNHNRHIDSNNLGSQRLQKLPDFSICDTLMQHGSWSTLDDEDWLCPSSEHLHLKPKAEVEEDTSQQVWAEAVYLPSVDMYALPYVVPY